MELARQWGKKGKKRNVDYVITPHVTSFSKFSSTEAIHNVDLIRNPIN